jgi:hypothetical protein
MKLAVSKLRMDLATEYMDVKLVTLSALVPQAPRGGGIRMGNAVLQRSAPSPPPNWFARMLISGLCTGQLNGPPDCVNYVLWQMKTLILRRIGTFGEAEPEPTAGKSSTFANNSSSCRKILYHCPMSPAKRLHNLTSAVRTLLCTRVSGQMSRG